MKVDERKPTRSTEEGGVGKKTDMGASLPELFERACVERDEPVPMLQRSDGTFECLAASACERQCRDKTLDPMSGY